MAFSENYLQPQQWDFFEFYTSTTNPVDESINISKTFRLMEVRVHCSVAFLSVEDLTIRLSSPLGSQYNQMFVSQPMSDVRDFHWIADNEFGYLFGSTDQLVVALSQKVGGNNIGIKVFGWSVQE